MSQQIYGFGSFQLNVAERQLTSHASAIRLHAKVFDTLVVLISAAGRLLRKEALMTAIWPNHVVEENNLQHNICVLRRVLAHHDSRPFIETVPGQGYRFSADVHILKPGLESGLGSGLESGTGPEVITVPRVSAAPLAINHRAAQGTKHLRPAPRWPAAPLNDAEQLAALSQRLNELRCCFRDLAGELVEVEQRLQQRGSLAAGVRRNVMLP